MAATVPSELFAVASSVEPRTLQQFPPELQHVIQLLALNDVARPVGSGAFTVHLYPSDLDLFERAYGCCGPEDSAAYFASRLQTNARRIALEGDNVYFVEVKAGTDTRFQPPGLGHKDNADIYSIEPATVQQFDHTVVMRWAEHAQKINLITDAEFDEVVSLTREAEYRISEWQALHDWFRSRWILRWSLKEVIDGFKPLRRDNTMPTGAGVPGMLLKDAILQGTLVKMDLLTFSQSRLIPAEAVYDLLAYSSPDQRASGSPAPQRLTISLGDYATNLRRDVIMYSSADHFNPLKVAKRIWALAVQEKYAPLVGALSTLFQSDVAAANQVLSDAKELQKAMSQLTQIPVSKLVRCVLTFPKRLANHVAPESSIYDLAVQISSQWFAMLRASGGGSTFDRAQAASLLDPLIQQLQKLVNQFAVQYMQPLVPMLRQLTLSLTNPASSTGNILLSSVSSSPGLPSPASLPLLAPPAPVAGPRRRPSAASVAAAVARPQQLMVCSTTPPPPGTVIVQSGQQHRRRRGSTIVMMPESQLTHPTKPQQQQAVAQSEKEEEESGEDSEGSLSISSGSA